MIVVYWQIGILRNTRQWSNFRNDNKGRKEAMRFFYEQLDRGYDVWSYEQF